MTISYVGGDFNRLGSTVATVVVPSNAVAGDVALLFVNGVTSPPAGFTQYGSSNQKPTFYKVLVSGDAGAQVTVANQGGDVIIADLAVYRGAKPPAPSGQFAGDEPVGPNGTLTAPAVTNPNPNGLVVRYYAQPTAPNLRLSAPAGHITRAAEGTDNGGTFTAKQIADARTSSTSIGPASISTQSQSIGLTRSVALEAFNSPPTAPTLSAPVGGQNIDRGITQRFSWLFSDPDAVDNQSQYDLQYRVVGTQNFTLVSAQTPLTFRDFPGGTFAVGNYEWQVRTYDAQGLSSPLSSSGFFSAIEAPPGPVITAPTNNQTVTSTALTLTWTASAQDAFQARTTSPDGGQIHSDSGTVVSTARSYGLTFPVNNRTERVQLRVRSQGLWSPWSTVTVSVAFTPPAAPTIVLREDDAAATVHVAFTNPAASGGAPAAVANDLRRRETAVGGEGIRIATNVGVGQTYPDRTPGSGTDYEYQGVAVAANGTTASSPWTRFEPGRYVQSEYDQSAYA